MKVFWQPRLRLLGLLLGIGSMLSLRLPAQTLGEALNAEYLTWTTSGDSSWFAQTNVTHDGAAAAQTGPISNSQPSILQTTVTGPGTLTFWWQVPSQGSHRLSLVVDGVIHAEIFGSRWRQQTNYLGDGDHVVQWIFAAFGSPDDAGWVDEVNFTPGATEPRIISQPVSQSQAPGLNSTFTVVAVGTPPLSYQWRFNGINIAGAQGSSYVLTNMQVTKAGEYSVVVSNDAGGVTSSVAQLSLVSVATWGGINEAPPGLTDAIAIAAGDYGRLAIRSDGIIVGWGNNAYGQTNIPAGLKNAVGIAAGRSHCVALKADGTAVAWGRNNSGQTNVPPDLTNVVAIATGDHHCLALKADGTVIGWGSTNWGETTIPIGLTNVVAISAGLAHSMALRSDGTVTVWGWHDYGLRNVPPGLTNAIAIEAGFTHKLALRADGTVIGWGQNNWGETTIPIGLTNVVAISAGTFRSLALKANGEVVSWGASTTVPSGLANVQAVSTSGGDNLAIVGNSPVTHASSSRPAWSSNGFSLSLPTQCGRVYQLEHKESLDGENWTALPLVPGNGGLLTLTDPSAAREQRYYRVIRW